jgi:sugar/nucleoside kinase (ribokinase family)
MTIDVAVVGAPFLDVTFAGLERIPQIGEELLARSMHIGPGGTGMQAIGAVRLGLVTSLVAPIGRLGGAGIVRTILESEEVTVVGEPASDGSDLPTTALLSTPEGVAMATTLGGGEPPVDDITATGARAIVMSLGRLHLAPRGSTVVAVTGGLELPGIGEATLARLGSVHALVLNAAEASALTGQSDPELAGRELARHGPTVVVTLGSDGALAAQSDRVVRASAPPVDVIDATGAGDLFVSAYIWAQLRGAPLDERLAWAALYAGLSVRAPTALEGALRLSELLTEGEARGLEQPPGLASG